MSKGFSGKGGGKWHKEHVDWQFLLARVYVPGASSAFPEHIFQAFDVAADFVDDPLAGAVAAVSRNASHVLPRDPLGRRVGHPFATLVHVPRLHQPLAAQALKDFLDRITAHRSNPRLSLILEPLAKK